MFSETCYDLLLPSGKNKEGDTATLDSITTASIAKKPTTENQDSDESSAQSD